MIIDRCPKCERKTFRKDGKVTNRQRYLCKSCGYKFSVSKIGNSIDNYYVVRALQLYLEGLSSRNIGKYLGVSHATVITWVKRYGKGLADLRLKDSKKIEEVNQVKTCKGDNVSTYSSALLLIGRENKCIILKKS